MMNIFNLDILNETGSIFKIKENKTINNNYNLVGKSYNKKTKYKTQESNISYSFEFILNKEQKYHYYNILNNNNYYLLKQEKTIQIKKLFNIDNGIEIYINISDFPFDLDALSYNENHTLNLYIEQYNYKYALYLDTSYDYKLNGKYKFINTINKFGEHYIGSAYIVDICYLTNNTLEFNLINENKYKCNFNVSVLNYIIDNKAYEDNGVVVPKDVFNYNFNPYFSTYKTLKSKTLPINDNYFLTVDLMYNNNGVTDNNNWDAKYNIGEPRELFLRYNKFYISNDLLTINKLGEFTSHTGLFINEDYIGREEGLHYALYGESEPRYLNHNENTYDLLVSKNENNIFCVSVLTNTNDKVKSYFEEEVNDEIILKYDYKFNVNINQHTELLTYEIFNDDINIIDYKNSNFSDIVDILSDVLSYKKTYHSDYGISNQNALVGYSIKPCYSLYYKNGLFYSSIFISDYIYTTKTDINCNISKVEVVQKNKIIKNTIYGESINKENYGYYEGGGSLIGGYDISYDKNNKPLVTKPLFNRVIVYEKFNNNINGISYNTYNNDISLYDNKDIILEINKNIISANFDGLINGYAKGNKSNGIEYYYNGFLSYIKNGISYNTKFFNSNNIFRLSTNILIYNNLINNKTYIIGAEGITEYEVTENEYNESFFKFIKGINIRYKFDDTMYHQTFDYHILSNNKIVLYVKESNRKRTYGVGTFTNGINEHYTVSIIDLNNLSLLKRSYFINKI